VTLKSMLGVTQGQRISFDRSHMSC